MAIGLSRVSFFTALFLLLFLTYLVVSGLIAFFTVKIVGIPIGRRMFTKIVLSIIAFIPLYVLLAYATSRFISRDLLRLEERVRKLPFSGEAPGSWLSEIHRLGEVINLQSERIKDMINAQRFMLYRITHDLKTPITNLRNVLTAIKEGVIGEEEREEYLDKLIRETEKMEKLLDEALSNLKKVSRETRKERVELCSFIRELLKIWELRLRQKGVEYRLDCEEGTHVFVSSQDLEEIINNLIENTLKHSSSRLIRVEVRKREGSVTLKLFNEGDEVDPSEIREAYRKGSLGLYIVRELAWKNGLEFRISLGKGGTQIILLFPTSEEIL